MFSKLITLLAVPALTLAQTPPPVQDTTVRMISIQDAVRLARENNVQAIQSANSIRSAENAVRGARAQVLPSLSASLGQGKSKGERLGQSGTLVPYTSQWTYNTGLSSQIILFDGFKTYADVRTQKANVVAAEATQTTTQFSLARDVKTQYNLILAANESEAAARAQLALAEAQLATAVVKVNAGAVPVSDSLKGVVAVGNARLAILSAQQNQRTASAALTRLVGTQYFVTANPADTVDRPVSPIDVPTVMQLALGGPTIRQADASVASLRSAQRATRAQYLPTVTANVSYGGSGVDPYGFGPNNFPYNRSLSLSLGYNVFNKFQRENAAAAAQINVENAEANLRDQKLSAQQNIITQLGALQNAEESMRIQQLNVRASEEDLRVQQQRYNLGAGLLLELLASQSNLINARQQLIQARFNYRNARAQIEAIIGRDLP